MGGAAKDTDKQNKNKKSLETGFVDSIKDLQRNRMMVTELLFDIQRKKEEGDSQAKSFPIFRRLT